MAFKNSRQRHVRRVPPKREGSHQCSIYDGKKDENVPRVLVLISWEYDVPGVLPNTVLSLVQADHLVNIVEVIF